MFNRRFFTPRYFAPVYFAGPPPPPGEVLLRIGNRDGSNYLYYGAPIRWNLMRGGRGTASLPLIIPPADPFAPQVGDAVEIFDPLTVRTWSGAVESFHVSWLGDDGWRVITLTCISLDQLFDTSVLDKVEYSAPTTCGAAVADLYSRSGVTAVTLGTVDAGPIVKALQVSNVAQGYTDLALLAGFVWYVDPLDNTLNFHAPADRAADWALASTDVLFETMEYDQSRADYRSTQFTQLPEVAQSPVTASFDGNAITENWTLPSVPSYLIAVNVLPAGKGTLSISWLPGSDIITVAPAMLAGNTLVVQYADVSGQASHTNPAAGAIGVGNKAQRSTRTRTYTAAGGLQETEAILARYSMLPSSAQFSTDKPGIGIARALTVALAYPVAASDLLNGVWLVTEIEAVIVPGLEMQPEPYGHFRYTIHMVNTAATAIFRGDGSSTVFTLPEVPASAPEMRIVGSGVPSSAVWTIGTSIITVTPALSDSAALVVDYRGAEVPDIPSFLAPWENMPGGSPAGDAIVPPDPLAATAISITDVFTRTLTLFDTTVRDDAAPHTAVYHSGIALRLLGYLRKNITADLTVRINKTKEPDDLTLEELITVTIPAGTIPDEVLEWSLASGSPAVLPSFLDKEVFTADILESDGSKAKDGVAQFTIEWTDITDV